MKPRCSPAVRAARLCPAAPITRAVWLTLGPGAESHNAAEEHHDEHEPEHEHERGRSKLSLPLHIPKNRSTGNLAINTQHVDRSRLRFSFDAGALTSADLETVTRFVIRSREKPLLALTVT